MNLESIRLIAIDLDGTLLRKDGALSKNARKAIKKLQALGTTVVIATGRPSTSAIKASEWLGCKGPVIACNGAHILKRENHVQKSVGPGGTMGAQDRISPASKGWEEIRFIPISSDVLEELIALIRGFQVYFHLHLKGAYAVERQYLRKAPRKSLTLRRILLSLTGLLPASPMKILKDGGYLDYIGQTPKVCIDGPRDRVFEVKRAIEEAFRGRLQCIMTGPAFMEVMDARINKGEALSVVGETVKIPLSQMAALGDGDNDVEMLSRVGVGVAMANASPALCLCADRFTYSCDEDGVSEFLKEVLDAKTKSKLAAKSPTG